MSAMIEKRKLRKAVFKVHTWLGLHLCLILGVIFLSGALLLFSPELKMYRSSDLWVAPDGATQSQVSAGQIYDAVADAYPGARINIIASQPRAWFGRPVYINANGKALIAHVDPYSGEVLGHQVQRKVTLRDAIRRLHDSLLVPFYTFHIAVNALALVVLVLVVTGLISYRRFWKGWFRRAPAGADLRAKRGAQHRLVALWVAPFLLVSSLSAVVFLMNAVGVKAVSGDAPPVAERVERLPQTFDGAALDAIEQACRAAAPGFVEQGVTLPKNEKKPLRLNGYDTNVGSIFGTVACFADPVSGAVTGIVRASDGNWMTPLKALAVAVHYGTWGGWVSIALWTLFGIGSTYLALTGARVYAARILAERGRAEPALQNRGALYLVIQGLGPFKWAYALLVVGVLALLIRELI